MTTEHLRWIVESCTDYGALLFLWVGQFGTQPVLMPGHVYYWWIDDSPQLHDQTEDDGGRRRRDVIH